MTASSSNNDIEALPPAMALHTLALTLFAVVIGAFAAVVILPMWLPGLSTSLLGPSPKAYWYLSRATALVAYILLWLSMTLGVLITNKLARVWPGGPTAFDLHQHASLLGLAFALFHALILMGDKYIAYTLPQVLTPFASANYKPVWVGLGQIGFYLLALVSLSFYVRAKIGARTWRLIHFLSFAVYALAIVHSVWSGTDSKVDGIRMMYWVTSSSLLFFIVFRILMARFKPKRTNTA
jgi:predicted ferric reductase